MWIVLGAMAAWVLVFVALTRWKYEVLGYVDGDLAFFNQLFWSTLHGDFFGQTVRSNHALGMHGWFLIPPLTPFYALAPDPRTLLTLQVVALALPAFPIYLIARQRLGALSSATLRAVLPLFFPLAWLANPFVQHIAMDEFHLLPIALAPIFAAVYAYERGDRWMFLLMTGIALLLREDVAMVIAMLGAVAWIERRPLWWRITPVVIGAAWYSLALVIIAAFSNDGLATLLRGYAWLGVPGTETASFALLHPFLLLTHVVAPTTILFHVALGLPLLFLPLVRPQRLLLAAPIGAALLLIDGGMATAVLTTHRISLLLPALFLAAIEGARSLPRVAQTVPGFGPDDRRRFALIIMVAAVIYAMFALGPLPSVARRMVAKHDTDALHAYAVKNVMGSIRGSDAVAASSTLLPYASGRSEVYDLRRAFDAREGSGTARAAYLPETTTVLLADANDLLRIVAEDDDMTGFSRLHGITDAARAITGPVAAYDFKVRETDPRIVPAREAATMEAEGELRYPRAANDDVASYVVRASWTEAVVDGDSLVLTFMLVNDSGILYREHRSLRSPLTSDLLRSEWEFLLPDPLAGTMMPVISIARMRDANDAAARGTNDTSDDSMTRRFPAITLP